VIKVVYLSMILLALWVVVVACGADEAEFQVTSLELTPDVVVSGESTIVTATVENIGSAKGTYRAILRVDGKNAIVELLIIEAGETVEVEFTLLREIGPSVLVEMGGITKSLTIREG